MEESEIIFFLFKNNLTICNTKEDRDPYYDWALVHKVRRSLQSLRKKDDARGVLGVLETCIRANFAGTESVRLYSQVIEHLNFLGWGSTNGHVARPIMVLRIVSKVNCFTLEAFMSSYIQRIFERGRISAEIYSRNTPFKARREAAFLQECKSKSWFFRSLLVRRCIFWLLQVMFPAYIILLS